MLGIPLSESIKDGHPPPLSSTLRRKEVSTRRHLHHHQGAATHINIHFPGIDILGPGSMARVGGWMGGCVGGCVSGWGEWFHNRARDRAVW